MVSHSSSHNELKQNHMAFQNRKSFHTVFLYYNNMHTDFSQMIDNLDMRCYYFFSLVYQMIENAFFVVVILVLFLNNGTYSLLR